MSKFTNNSRGPRTINTKTGPVTLQIGESRDDLDVSKEEMVGLDALLAGPGAAASEQKQMAAGGDVDPEVKSLVDGNSKDQLLDIAEGEGVEDVTADNNKNEIATKIVAKRRAADSE